MQRKFRAALLLLPIMVGSCGRSLDTLNQLAGTGSIHEDAPVTTHLKIQIDAPTARVWALLIDISSWPKWQKQIESATPAGPIRNGTRFSWRTGGTEIHSQIQLFEPERRLAWTGTALTAKAIHVWELKPEPGNQTLVTVKESMDGPLMARIYPSRELTEADNEWLLSLKRAAEQRP